jgi:hypothetical protein
MTLISVSLATLGIGIAGDTVFILGTYAFYARNDVGPPLRSMMLRVSISFLGMAIALTLHGAAVLAGLGLSLSIAATVGALHLCRNFDLFTRSSECLRSVLRTIVASLAMAGPVFLVAWGVTRLLPPGHLGSAVAVIAAAATGAAIFLRLQSAWGAPEIASFMGAVRRRVPR